MTTVRAHDDLAASVDGSLPATSRRCDTTPCSWVVETRPLRNLLLGFVDAWARDRPVGINGSTGSFVSAVSYLASESGLSEATIKTLLSDHPQPTARWATADALVAAIGAPQAFHDGTLQISRRVGDKLVPLDD